MSESEGDLTRKQRREQAREERKQLEQEQAASAMRRTRLMQLAVVGVIVVAIIVGILVATGGGSSKGIQKGPEANTTVSEVSSLLGGIPQNGNTLGSPTAPVTLQYFGDLQCPVCRQFTLTALKPLIKNDVRSGKLRIEYRSLETATAEPATFKTQQVAALAAGKQQRAWYYIELFYHQQGEEHSGYVTESYLQGLAQQVPGLNLSKWSSDRSDPSLANMMSTDGQAASNFGFTGTPSFALAKTGTAPKKFEPESFTDPSSFEKAIQSLGG